MFITIERLVEVRPLAAMPHKNKITKLQHSNERLKAWYASRKANKTGGLKK